MADEAEETQQPDDASEGNAMEQFTSPVVQDNEPKQAEEEPAEQPEEKPVNTDLPKSMEELAQRSQELPKSMLELANREHPPYFQALGKAISARASAIVNADPKIDRELSEADRIFAQNQPWFAMAKAAGHEYMEQIKHPGLSPDTAKSIEDMGMLEPMKDSLSATHNAFMDGLVIPATRNTYEFLRKGTMTDVAALAEAGATAFTYFGQAPFEAVQSGIQAFGTEAQEPHIANILSSALEYEMFKNHGDVVGNLTLGPKVKAFVDADKTRIPAEALPTLPNVVAKAKGTGALEGEDVYFGTKEPTEQQRKDIYEAAAQYPDAKFYDSTANVHDVARAVDPEAFSIRDQHLREHEELKAQYDALREQKNADAENNIPHEDAISALEAEKAKLKTATSPKARALQAQIDELTSKQQDYIDEVHATETPEMEALKRSLQENFDKRVELAKTGRVQAAYTEAEKRLPPKEIQFEEPEFEAEPRAPRTGNVAEAVPESPRQTEVGETAELPGLTPKEVKSPEQQRASIVADATKQLVEIGRPLENAQAEAEIVADAYMTRAARWEGRKGTGEELYRANFPIVRAAVERSPNKAREIAQRVTGRELEQPAYHGSPFKFDKFTLDHIGKGEGAQAFGWGLYFAGKREVGEFYKKSLESSSMKVNGESIPNKAGGQADLEHLSKIIQRDTGATENEAFHVAQVIAGAPDKSSALNKIHNKVEEFTKDGEVKAAEAMRKLQIFVHRLKSIEPEGTGQLYEVDIPGDEELLDWDKPLHEQPEKVRETLAKMGIADNKTIPKIKDAIISGVVKKALKLNDGNPRNIGLVVDNDSELYHKVLEKMQRSGINTDNVRPGDYVEEQAAAHLKAIRDREEFTGKEIYNEIAKKHASKILPNGWEAVITDTDRIHWSGHKGASLELNSNGIKGIRYLDGMSRDAGGGHHNYVVFDDTAIKTLRTFYQEEKPGILDRIKSIFAKKEFAQEARGKIRLGVGNTRSVITLFKNANASTFMHEMGHHFLDQLQKDAADPDAPESIKRDWKTVSEWLGHEGGDIKTRHHEKFARGFERYLMEGVAPSKKMARVFHQFKQWLTQIYGTVKRLKSPINDDIRNVFDNMLSTNPEKTVYAGEAEPGKMLADIHEEDARTTPPGEPSEERRDSVRKEIDRTAIQHEPEVHDAVKDAEVGKLPEAVGVAKPSGSPNEAGRLSEQQPGQASPAQEPNTVAAGGVNTGAKSNGIEPAVPKSFVFARVPREPTSLAAYVKKLGGIKDVGGDVLNTIGEKRQFPGLISDKGRELDYLAEKAWEDGYFSEKGEQRPSINEFLDKLETDIKGAKQYSEHDAGKLKDYEDAVRHNEDIQRIADDLGITTFKSAKEFWDEVAAKTSQQESDRLAEELTSHLNNDYQDMVDAEKDYLDSLGDRESEPDTKPRTEREMEDEREQERLAAEAQARGEDTQGQRPAGAQGESPDRVRQGGGYPDADTPAPSDKPDPAKVKSGEQAGRAETDLIDKAGNIRLDNLNAPEDVSEVIRRTADENDDFAGARGVVPDAMVMDLADAMGVKAAEVNIKQIAANIGGGQLASKIMAARKLLIQSAGEVREAMARAADGTDEDVMAYAEAKARHIMIQESLSAVTAEAGRALRAFRELSDTKEGQEAQTIGDFLKDATGKDLFQMKREAKLGAALVDKMDSPAEATRKTSKFIQDSKKASFGDMILEYWINGLISGPATHTTYSIGNLLLTAWKALPESSVAALVGKAHEALGHERSGIRLGEVPAQLSAAAKNLPTALSAAGKALKTGVTTLLPGEEARTMPLQQGAALAVPGRIGNEAVTWHQLGQDTFSALKGMRDAFVVMGETMKSPDTPIFEKKISSTGSIPDYAVFGAPIPLGTTLRLPARAIAGIHSFFRTANYTMDKAALAYRAASEEGRAGADFAARVGDLINNPTEGMMERARETATNQTLMGRGGEFTQAISKLTNISVKLPVIGETKLLKFVDPFVHISSNVIDQALLRRSPLGLLSKEVRDDLMGKNGPEKRDFAQARMIVGSALAITIGGLAAEGKISGSGPSNPKELAAWKQLGGNQPHSVLIGDTWYDIHRLGPLGMLIGVSADLYETAHEMSKEDAAKVAWGVAHSFAQNILDESFMRGPSDLIKALTDSDRYGAGYARNLISSFVPYSVGMHQITRAVDPFQRETNTILEAVKAKIPWMSQELFPRVDVWGNPIQNKDVFGPAGLSAIYTSQVNKDPTNLALMKLKIYPNKVQEKIMGVPLTEKQHFDYATSSGRLAKMNLDKFVSQPQFTSLPDTAKINAINGIIRSARAQARNLIITSNPDLMKAIYDRKRLGLKH